MAVAMLLLFGLPTKTGEGGGKQGLLTHREQLCLWFINSPLEQGIEFPVFSGGH